jgi:2-phospho-L-lactate guanylyltransferase
MHAVETAVLMPVKAFTAAKGRLSVVLDRLARADLARWLAGRVVAARVSSRRSSPVTTTRSRVGRRSRASTFCGAPASASTARSTPAGPPRRQGFDHVVHRSQRPARGHRPGAARGGGQHRDRADRRRDGTNVIAMPVGVELPAAYGGARTCGTRPPLGPPVCPIEVRPDPRLSLDVDTPTDLAHPASCRTCRRGLRTILDNRH